MQNIIGNSVRGDDFYGRENEQAKLWHMLKKDNVLMLAPRRVGKTSLMLRLKDTCDERNCQVFLCSFAPCKSEFECVEQIIKSINESKNIFNKKSFLDKTTKIVSKISNFKIGPSGIEFDFANSNPEDWRKTGDALLEILSVLELDAIVCVDEVPIFILKLLELEDGLDRARGFLNWFRNMRQHHAQRIRWLLAGSIGLDTVVSRLKLGDTINDLDIFSISAFSPKVAENFLKELGNNNKLPLSLKIRKAIISKIGWALPYFLQVFFSRIYEEAIFNNEEVTIELVDSIYEGLLMPANRNYVDYWVQRLTEELGAFDAANAKHILNIACQDLRGVGRDILSQSLVNKIPDAAKRAELLNDLLIVLQTDGYLVEIKGKFQFRSYLIRDYWKRNVAHG